MEKLRIGLIGCGGRMGGHMSSFFDRAEDVQVVAVADPIEERRNNAAARYGVARVYKDHNELYAKESKETIDVLFIAIEPTAHVGVEETAVEKGIPFLVEKPMTLDVEQGRKLAKAIEEKNLVTAVGFQDRYLDLMEMVKAEVDSAPKGGLVYGAWIGGIPGPWWWQKRSTCGGQLVEQNIHLLDGLRWLYGEAISVYATASRGLVKPGENGVSPLYDTDDHSTVVIRFDNNVTATLVSACYVRGTRPFCGLGITLQDRVLEYHLRNNLVIRTTAETRDIPRKVDQTALLDRAFIDAVRAGDPKAVRSPYADALKTLELGFAANKSMETGQVIILR
ncbi:MAG: Gfo/Idh/MocA family oxidoreductase [Clostridia bacterium]|nr:Gfo/Idh/MocA family oxidoreductase [Clostridia bacterium]